MKMGGTPSPSQGEGAGGEVKENLPEFDDAFVQALGPFADVADFETKLKENLKLEKKSAKRKNPTENVEKIIAESELELPEILVEIMDKIYTKWNPISRLWV